MGDRFGFDGLESTTREILVELGKLVPPVGPLPEIRSFLRDADLVKFAGLLPTAAQCESALATGREIVEKTIPVVETGPARGAPAGIGPDSSRLLASPEGLVVSTKAAPADGGESTGPGGSAQAGAEPGTDRQGKET